MKSCAKEWQASEEYSIPVHSGQGLSDHRIRFHSSWRSRPDPFRHLIPLPYPDYRYSKSQVRNRYKFFRNQIQVSQ